MNQRLEKTCPWVRLLFATVALNLLSLVSIDAGEPTVVVYGATPAGIAAALAAGIDREEVLLIEPTARIGGLVTSGLSHTDIRTFEGITGAFLEFTQRVESHYQQTYGKDSAQAKSCERGIFGEPSVNLLVFEKMLQEHPNIQVARQTSLVSVHGEFVRRSDVLTIVSIVVRGADGQSRTVKGRVFIDATYEGDLMAAAGVKWRAGREARSEYGESLAPEAADDQLQAYNFRFIMTRDPKNRVKPVAPEGYRREDFLPVLEFLKPDQIKRVFDYPSDCLFKAQTPALPNDKHDINDVSRGLVRLSLPGQNLDWPNGDAKQRSKIFAEHLRDQVGLLYFLQNDEAVPQSYREEASQWGWCRDEFETTGHIPPQLYVREARRMVGEYVFTEKDTDHAPNDARSVLQTKSIAIGDYGPNCHGTAHEGPRFGGKHTGEFYKQVMPYQIPYGVLLPREVDNLLVPGAMSASHVGFCALRLEPIWMSLGQAAGHAATSTVHGYGSTRQIVLSALQKRLRQRGAATIYISDVPPGHPDFQLTQWWGLQGGWHGLVPQPKKLGERGANLHGQYYAAYPYHRADLDQPVDEATVTHWFKLANNLGLSLIIDQTKAMKMTRGQLLRVIGNSPARMLGSGAQANGVRELPRVLIIGDSISIGYTQPTRELLKGKAIVQRPDENCSSTGNGLNRLKAWIGDSKWDVIHFNFGLHDAKLPPEGVRHAPPEVYEKNLRELVKQMQATGAKLIFATTTPVPNGGILSPTRRFGSIDEYNKIALKVMSEAGVSINDLNAAIAPHLSKVQKPNDVHFTGEGSQILAQQVAKAIEGALE